MIPNTAIVCQTFNWQSMILGLFPDVGRRVLPATPRRETRSIPGVDWFPVEGPRRAESGRRDALRPLTQGTAPLILCYIMIFPCSLCLTK